MKLRLILLLTALVLLLGVSADNLGFTKEKLLLFSLDNNYPPMQYVDKNGNPRGYDVLFTEKLMERLDIPFEYKANNWDKVADDVMNGHTDLAMMVYSPYRKDSIFYSQAVFRMYYQLVFRKTDNIHGGLREIKGKTIALMKSRPIIDTLSRAGANYVIAQDLRGALKELSEGKYDGVICFRYQAKYLIDRLGLNNLVNVDLTLMPREYCYVSNNKALIDAIDRELAEMEKEGITADIYDQVMSSFDRMVIPTWVWWLLAGLVMVSLLVMLIQQRVNGRRLRQEMDRVRRTEELKDVFLGNISHALRTPLNAVVGFAELLASESRSMSEEEREDLARLVNKNGQQLSHLVDELTSIMDIEQNGQLLCLEEMDLLAAMNSYVESVRPLLHEGVEIKVEALGGRKTAALDKRLMSLVTGHFLKNAAQHTTEGRITLSYGERDNGLYVEVRDTGSGIAPEFKETIFALLSDKNAYMKDDLPGLGLTICKAVMDQLDGTIGVRDNEIEGRGTVFWYWGAFRE